MDFVDNEMTSFSSTLGQNEAHTNVRRIIQEEGINFVRLETEDMNGISRGVLMDVDHFMENIEEGFSLPFFLVGCIDFKGRIIQNPILDEKTNFSNGVLYPDLKTFRNIPWKKNTASVICDLASSSCREDLKPCSLFHTRSICKKQLVELNNLGFDLKSSLEYEFYVVNKDSLLPIDDEENYLSTFFNEKSSDLASTIMSSLKGYDIKPEKFHMECGPSMHEITIKPYFGIEGPDNAMRFRSTVKETCLKDNVHALFMTMPYQNEEYLNGQFNHSLWDINRESNLFFESPRKLSRIGKSWLAGLKAHSKALACLALPTYNCYKCFNKELDDPMLSMNSAWGYDNRTVGFRAKIMNSRASYIEYRVPGAAVNPYLVMTGLLIAGLDGIKRNLDLEEASYDGVFSQEPRSSPFFNLPRSLEEALDHLQEDSLFVEKLGKDFVLAFVTLKKNEIETMKKHSESEEELWKFQLQYYKHI